MRGDHVGRPDAMSIRGGRPLGATLVVALFHPSTLFPSCTGFPIYRNFS